MNVVADSALSGFHLSPAQRRLWRLAAAGRIPEGQAVTARFAWRGAPPARSAVAEALSGLVRRHEALRVAFLRLAEMRLPLQVAPDGAAFRLDGDADPPARGPALRAGMDAEGLTLSLPALCADAPTVLRLGAALGEALAGRGDGPGEEPVQFLDLAQWQSDLAAGEDARAWPEAGLVSFDGPWPPLPALGRGPRSPFSPARQACPVPDGTGARLRETCARAGVAPVDLLAAVWAVLLRRLLGGAAVPVAVVDDGRAFAELASAMGPLAAPVPLDLDANLSGPGTDFVGLARAAAAARSAAADLRHHLAPPDDDRFAPFPIEVLTVAAADGAPLRLADVAAPGEPALLKLTAVVGPGDALRLDLDCHADALREGAAARMAEQFATLLCGVLAEPGAPLDRPDLLGPAERHLVAVAFQGPRVDHGAWRPVHRAVAERAAADPGRVAVEDRDGALSAAALEDAVESLARRLEAAGVGPDRVVALHLPRSCALAVGMLAVLRAGGAYLPLPPDTPPDRLRYMLRDSGARVAVTLPGIAEALPDDLGIAVVHAGAAPGGGAGARRTDADPDHAAYVLYTSGSTGWPKGVVVTHRSLANHMAWMCRAFPLGREDAVLQKTPASFDASVWEFFLPLMSGARLVMAEPGLERDVPALVRALERGRITALQVVPSLLRVLVDEAEFPGCGALRRVFCGGEELTADLARRFAAVQGAELVNLYGPTETTVQVCAGRVGADDDPVPVGRPIDNVRVLVVDGSGRPVPIGVRGEILIGGAAPARGYLNRPELTAARFVADPVDPSAPPVYRSGDHGAWRPDGRLVFLGRADDQVKLRGYRIELGEVEASVLDHPDVARAAVWVDRTRGGVEQLVCAYDCRAGHAVQPAGLRDWLSVRLPDPMIPARCRWLDALPVNPSGKVDRAALRAMDAEPDDGVAPRNATELRLERIWAEVLGLDALGVDQSFFDLGGHSLLAVRLMAAVRGAFGCDLPLGSLFGAPTVSAQAALVQRRAAPDPVVIPIHRGAPGVRPLFLVHPTGGGILCYRDLARHLGDERPVFALQDPGLESTAAYGSVEELAALYVDRIGALAGDGPFYLAGWSSGGVIAFEMASQLLARGEEVGLLILIDSVAAAGGGPGPEPDASLVRPVAQLLAFNADAAMPDPSGFGGADAMDRLHAFALQLGVLPPEGSRAWLDRLFDVFRRNVDVVSRYRPGSYPRRLLLLRAAEPLPDALRDAAAVQRSDAPDLGWGLRAAVRCQDIPAHHLSIVREPAVSLVGAEIRRAMQEADRIQAIGDRVFFSLLGH